MDIGRMMPLFLNRGSLTCSRTSRFSDGLVRAVQVIRGACRGRWRALSLSASRALDMMPSVIAASVATLIANGVATAQGTGVTGLSLSPNPVVLVDSTG